MDLAVYLAVGAVAGLLAGLFGIGGGLVIVPVLVLSFELQGINADVLTHLAVGTSLATIVFTSLSSIKAHHAKGAIDWSLCRWLSGGIVIGAILGVKTVGQFSGELLQLIIGLFALVIAVQMGFDLKPKGARELPGRVGLVGAGSGIGWMSAMFGIGGGSLTVPFLSWNNVAMQRAVATAAACGFPIALAGALTNMVEGYGNPALPTSATGFVYWPAFIGIVVTSVPMAKVGAKLAHKLPAKTLKRIFALLLVAVAIRFLS